MNSRCCQTVAAVNKVVWPGGSVAMARDIKRVTRARMTSYITSANCCSRQFGFSDKSSIDGLQDADIGVARDAWLM